MSFCLTSEVVEVADEADVELDEVGLDLDHRLQARVAGAGVVDGDAEAVLAQLARRPRGSGSKSSMMLFSVISMTVLARSASGVAATNSSMKRSLRAVEEEVDRLGVDEAQASSGSVALPRAAIEPADAVELVHAALVAGDFEQHVGPVQLALHAGRGRAPRSRARRSRCRLTMGW